MFYILSKVLGIFINPIIWILGVLIVGFFAKQKKLKRRLFLTGIILTLIFSNSFILNEFLHTWELNAVPVTELKQKYEYGIVLGGMVWFDSETKRINFLQSSDRIWQTVRLYKLGYLEKILISGGAANFFQEDTVESVLLKNFLIDIGIPAVDIITEEMSRNTHENAVYTAEIIKNVPHENILLITSAMHMRRAQKCFTKIGLPCDIYPTDHYTGARRFTFDQMFIPNARTLFNWNAFIHELFGMASYKISGYI